MQWGTEPRALMGEGESHVGREGDSLWSHTSVVTCKGREGGWKGADGSSRASGRGRGRAGVTISTKILGVGTSPTINISITGTP
jgi:hypothetical protein